jgi:hypothetical protein
MVAVVTLAVVLTGGGVMGGTVVVHVVVGVVVQGVVGVTVVQGVVGVVVHTVTVLVVVFLMVVLQLSQDEETAQSPLLQ